jgi:DNA modification methylase
VSVRILQGDVREILSTLPSDHFDCVVTSPPYWGLRDYGVEGQIGLEPTLTEYLDTMTALCRQLRRVLKPEGTFWLNIGDSYA